MYEDLKYFFFLSNLYRSATVNILQKNIIVDQRMPELYSRTRSQRLKLQVGRFLKEASDERNRKRSSEQAAPVIQIR